MIILAIFLVSLLFFNPAAEALNIQAGEAAPDFTLSSTDGNTVSLSEYKDEAVALIYWRTGQKRSLLALKDGNDVLKEFKKKKMKILSIIAGSDNKDDAEKTFSENGIGYPLLVDYDRVFYSTYGIRVYPTTIIIDKEGKVSYTIPSHPLTYKKLLKGYIRKTIGEIDEAGLKEVLSTKKEGKDKTEMEALRRYNLALKFTQSGMHDLAIDTVLKAIKAKPEMTRPHVLLGFLYLETNEPDQALDAFNKALELDSDSKDAKTGLGGALILKGKADSAIEILKDAATTNPYPQMAYYELGRAYELKGDKDQSIEMFKKAIEKIVKKNILPSAISKCH